MHLLVSTKLWGEASSPQFLACNLMPTIKVRYLTDGPFDKGGNEFRPQPRRNRDNVRDRSAKICRDVVWSSLRIAARPIAAVFVFVTKAIPPTTGWLTNASMRRADALEPRGVP